MIPLVLDTSVAIAWYLPEVFSPPARSWQERLLRGEITFHVPSLHYWELANVLRSHVRRSQLDEKLAREVWAVHLDAPLTVTDPARPEVLATALHYGATAYDAVYIALALQLDARLLTAERPTTNWIARLGSRVVSISD